MRMSERASILSCFQEYAELIYEQGLTALIKQKLILFLRCGSIVPTKIDRRDRIC